MGWSLGFDFNWNRDVGYGVPCICDYPGCNKPIDRGLSYVCGGDVYGGEHGCGLFFCDAHLGYSLDSEISAVQLCERCLLEEHPFPAKPDLLRWVRWKRLHHSWAAWRRENNIPPWNRRILKKKELT